MHTFCMHRNQKKTNHQTLEMRAEMFLFEERTRWDNNKGENGTEASICLIVFLIW